jgi:predicted enzyme related to lactoylglutathione lyase
MIAIDAVYIEVAAADPERLAGFYQQLFGLERSDAAGAVVLAGAGVVLRSKPGGGDDADAGPIAFGFRAAPGVDLARCREEAVAAGAIVLSESKRGAVQTLACQDPAGNEFVVVAGQPDGAVAVEQSHGPTRSAAAAAPPPPQAAPPRPAGRVTRRDVDRLRDVERLAQMQETIAGLHVPFSTDDPASALADMRAKLGTASPVDRSVAEADEAMRAREREAAVDDLLRRYQAELRGSDEPAAPAPAPPTSAPPEPTARPEAEPPAPERPRTLARSDKADDE